MTTQFSEEKSEFSRDTFWKGLRLIKQELTPHKHVIGILGILSVVGSLLEALIPYLAGRIVDEIILIAQHPGLPVVSVFSFIALWLILRSVSDFMDWRIGLKSNESATLLFGGYLARGFGRLFEMPIELHKKLKHGNIGEKINRAANALEGILNRVLIPFFSNVLTILAAFVIVFLIQPVLAAILLACVVVYALILWRSVPPLAGLQKGVNKEYSAAYGSSYDALGSIQEIKYAATEAHEQEKIYGQFVHKAGPLFVKLVDLMSRIDFYQRVLIIVAQLAIFSLSVYFVQQGSITPGELVAFNGYAAMVFGPFVILGRNWKTVQNGLVSLIEADEILSHKTEVYLPEAGVTPLKLQGAVSFERVWFSYSNASPILKSVSFEVKPGEHIALVGESGVGKSTLVSILLGLYEPTKGVVKVDGRPIGEYNLKAYRSRFGVVPQEPTLFNDTVTHNIRYGSFDADLTTVKKAARQAHAHEFIRTFDEGYEQEVGWRGIKLSIGQKQRIALARAFLRDPDILVLDEPTSALDAKSEQYIKESLNKLMKGRTSFIIAHRLSTVREADKILVFDKGRIVEAGTHAELIKNKRGIYKALYDLQFETQHED